MAFAELKEALILIKRLPLLWVPGIIGGFLAASLWVIYNLGGMFFSSRLLVIAWLVLLVFTTGMLVVIRNNGGDIRAMLEGGARYYFKVLLPQLVIIFIGMVVVLLVMITFALLGATSDTSMATALTIGFMIPTIILTFFFDTAAVFEERKVFESLKRSIQLVFAHMNEVIAFLLIWAAIFFGIIFCLMAVWSFFLSMFLYDNLEPITRYNETQLLAFTPDQLLTMIGTEGMWITALVIFVGGFLLITIFYSYKSCFYKKIAQGVVITQEPTTGEYDSKGRYYKY
jgi:hypothetical protein